MKKLSSRIRMCGAQIAITCVVAIFAAGAAAAADSPQDVGSGSAQVEALVAEAVEHSPAVIAARAHYQATLKVPSQVATLPDPEVSLQQLTVGGPKPFEGYETSDFFYTGFGASQEIPWPSKLKLRAREASHEAEAARQEYEAARRDAAEKVRENSFELFFLDRRIALLTDTRTQLSGIEQITEDQYRLGKSQQQDVIKAQLTTTSILKELEMTRQEMGERQAALKAILGRDIDSRNIAIPEIAPTATSLDRAQLAELAAAGATEIRAAEAMKEKSEASLKLARADYVPDFSLGYMYQKTGPGFRDYYMLTLGAKIPLYFWRKQRPAVEQAALEREAAKDRVRSSRLDSASEAEREWLALKTQERIIAIYRDG
ncbi:MAG TPA: TolC family protein, partial [Candidatus Binataceae bacterium]|nr:TolC family protein [Candidatus Binataceae bacterium]